MTTANFVLGEFFYRGEEAYRTPVVAAGAGGINFNVG